MLVPTANGSQVAEVCLNPLGSDDDDFDTCQMLDDNVFVRTLSLSLSLSLPLQVLAIGSLNVDSQVDVAHSYCFLLVRHFILVLAYFIGHTVLVNESHDQFTRRLYLEALGYFIVSTGESCYNSE